MIKIKNKSISWFQIFKYIIYLLLCYNVFLFLKEDISSSSVMFSDGVSFKTFIVGYSGSIDTAAWVILLLVFELETYVIDDDHLQKGLKWTLKLISALCYSFILYSFYGYLKKHFWHLNFQTLTDTVSTCTYIGHSWLKDFDEFIKITAENCESFNGSTPLQLLTKEHIITNTEILNRAKLLAFVDIINSFAWLVVVVILEIEVWLQLKNKLTAAIEKTCNIIKITAYTLLVISGITWGIYGLILDTWDSFLWIIAFVFIEMNMILWQKETESETKQINTTS